MIRGCRRAAFLSAWARVRHRIGRRGAALLFFAGLDLIYGYALAFPTPGQDSPTNRYFTAIMPPVALGSIWATVGVICLYHAFQRHDRFGFNAAIMLKMMWGGLALLGVWSAHVPIASPAIWLSLAGLVGILAGWREPEPKDD